jgi:hypothetical protein
MNHSRTLSGWINEAHKAKTPEDLAIATAMANKAINDTKALYKAYGIEPPKSDPEVTLRHLRGLRAALEGMV